MTDGPKPGHPGRGDSQQSDQNGEEPRVVIRDKRRIDPHTGSVRDVNSPFPGAPEQGSNPADPAQAGQPISATITADSEEFAKLAAELAERTADLQRVSAEYANYRKRVDRDREALLITARASVVAELLSVLDDLELAKAHGDLTGAFKTVADRLTGVLERLGLKGFAAPGDEFDPAHHEAVQFGTSPDVQAPTVTAVLRRGYSFKDKPLRAAVVAVTGPEAEGDSMSAPNTPAAEAADAADRNDDAAMRTEQESKSDSAAATLAEDTTEGSVAPSEDPA